MNLLSKLLVTLLIATGAATATAGVISNAPVTYTNRAAFEAALGNFKVDNLNGVKHGYFTGVLNRADFSINTPGAMYGCQTNGDCGDNSGRGIFLSNNGPSYLWNYSGADTFTFSNAVNGFGFDFADPTCCSSGSRAMINGQTSSAQWGFFGIISSQALTSFNVNQTGSYMVFDNVTFGTTTKVPEPALPALMAVGLLGLALARRQKRK